MLLTLVSSLWAIDLCQYQGQKIRSKEIEGLETTRSFVVEREFLMESTFDCALWTQEKDELESVGIFAEVGLKVEPGPEGLTLRYQFKELLPWLALPAMKQSDQVGWMLGPGLAAVNLLGRDIFVQAFYRTDVSPKFNTTDEFLITLHSKYLGDIPLEYGFAWAKLDTYNELKEFFEKSQDLKLNLSYPIWQNLDLLMTLGDYMVERDSTQGFYRESGTSHSPHLGGGLRWDGIDNLTNPRSGFYQELQWRQYGKKLGGSTESDFSELLWDQRSVNSWGRHIFIATTLVRWRQGQVPFYERLEPGGANSFRPWAPGSEHSGESEVLGNLEYRFEWIPKTIFHMSWIDQSGYWGLQPVVGADLVNIWSKQSSQDELTWGYYGGVHILIPAINRIRIEFGNEYARMDWVMQIGLFEKSESQKWRVR